MIEAIKRNRFLFIPLIISLLFFLRKGIQFAWLGSYVPLGFLALFLIPLVATVGSNERLFLRISKIWALVIMVWGIVRIFISVVNYAFPTFDEYHLSSQLGLYGMGLSVLMLGVGIMIMRYGKRKRATAWL